MSRRRTPHPFSPSPPPGDRSFFHRIPVPGPPIETVLLALNAELSAAKRLGASDPLLPPTASAGSATGSDPPATEPPPATVRLTE